MARTAPFKQRLFVALPLPEEARAQIVEWQHEVLGEHGRVLRLVRPASLHVTLVFLGWVAGDPFGHVATSALGPSGEGSPELTVTGVTAVPPRRPRLWALSLGDAGDRAAKLQSQIARSLEAGGVYTPEERPFWPHVTVARLRASARAPRLDLPPPAIRFTAGTVVLYRSHLSREGAEYEVLSAKELGPPAG